MKPSYYKALITVFLVFFSTFVLGNQAEAQAQQPFTSPDSLQNQELNNQLFFAIKNNDYEIIRYLVAKGADPNTQNSEGVSLLNWSVIHGHILVVEVLLFEGGKN